MWGEKGASDKALDDFDSAIRLDPNNVRAYFNRGLASAHNGGYQNAIKDFDRVIRLDPKNLDAYNARACRLRKLGSVGKGRSRLQRRRPDGDK